MPYGTGLCDNNKHCSALVDSHLEHADSVRAEKIAKRLGIILEIPAVTRESDQLLQLWMIRTMPALNVEQALGLWQVVFALQCTVQPRAW